MNAFVQVAHPFAHPFDDNEAYSADPVDGRAALPCIDATQWTLWTHGSAIPKPGSTDALRVFGGRVCAKNAL